MAQGKAHKPTERTRGQIEGLILAGYGIDDICRIVDLSKKTLYKHYRVEIEETEGKKKSDLANLIWRKALDEENIPLMIFLAKTRLRWRETERIGEQDQSQIRPITIVYKELEKKNGTQSANSHFNGSGKRKTLPQET